MTHNKRASVPPYSTGSNHRNEEPESPSEYSSHSRYDMVVVECTTRTAVFEQPSEVDVVVVGRKFESISLPIGSSFTGSFGLESLSPVR
jgi:hypothetical protein